MLEYMSQRNKNIGLWGKKHLFVNSHSFVIFKIANYLRCFSVVDSDSTNYDTALL